MKQTFGHIVNEIISRNIQLKLKRMNLYLLIVQLLVLLFPNKISATKSLVDLDSVHSENECQILNEKYWTIIEEFYGSINLISLYLIHPAKPNALKFALPTTLLEQIPKSMLILLIFQYCIVNNNLLFIIHASCFPLQNYFTCSIHLYRARLCRNVSNH